MVQTILASAVLAVVLFVAVRHFYRSFSGKSSGCDSCSSDKSCNGGCKGCALRDKCKSNSKV